MGTVFSFIPMFLGIALLGCLIKLAARLLGGTKINWKQAFAFAFIWFLIALIPRLYSFATSLAIDPLISFFCSIILVVALGGLFFKGRATSTDGKPFEFVDGAKFSAFVVGIGLLMCLPLVGLFVYFRPV